MSQSNQKMYKKNIHVLESIGETIVFCGQQNLPLRGHRDGRTSTSSNRETCHFEATGMVGQVHRPTGKLATSRPQGWSDKYIVQQGNFWAILEMMAKRNDTLREHLTRRKNAQYTSRFIYNEVIDAVAEYIRKENTRSLEDENAFFSIMVDEVTDPHGNCQCAWGCCLAVKSNSSFLIICTLRGQRGKL